MNGFQKKRIYVVYERINYFINVILYVKIN
jgi:hypothetical protein